MLNDGFTDGPVCRSRRYCVECRSTAPDAVRWRESHSRYYLIPEVCPFGAPINAASRPPIPAVAVGEDTPATRAPAQSNPAAGPMDIAGPGLWASLHASESPSWELIRSITLALPCGDCRGHWIKMLAESPPEFGEGWFAWTVLAHNAVNQRIGKPPMSLASARARWHGTEA